MAKLRDVADLAGVDPSTASRVLRGDPAQHVRPETRQRILDAARELGYRPNALARSLRTRRTGMIGLLVPSLDNLGFAGVTHGIQRAATEAGRALLMVEAQAHPTAAEVVSDELYERLVGDGLVDGLIVAFASLRDDHVSNLADRGIPLVLVNRRTSGVSGSVVVDDLRGSRMAVENLLRLGHRRVGFVGLDAETDTAVRRRQGYREAVAAAGVGVRPELVASGPPTIEGGQEAVARLLEATGDEPPTAIFVASLMSALGVRTALSSRGLRVPHDISLVAFNDHPIAEHLDPPLTTVRMPSLEMGAMAVGLLLRAIDGEPVGDVMVEEPPPTIMHRASTRAPAPSARTPTGEPR
jgi:LacI family transcriptional regulator